MASTAHNQEALVQQSQMSPLIKELSDTWKMTPATLVNTVMQTLMPKDGATIPQVMAFLQVANQYRLNPFLKQIYAFPSKGGGIVPMVPIDGWVTLVQNHPQYDGVEFEFEWSEGGGKTIDARTGTVDRKLVAVTCIMHRKDQTRPTKVTEYMSECYRDTEPWKKWPVRMLRHKVFIQCARIAFGIAGVYDEDEAERIAETPLPGQRQLPGQPAVVPNVTSGAAAILKEKIDAAKGAAKTVEAPAAQAAPAPVEAERNEEPPVMDEPPDEIGEAQPAEQQEEAPAAKSESRTPETVPAAWGDDGTVEGTVVKMFPPKKQGNGMRMGVQMAGYEAGQVFDFSIWDTKVQEKMKAEQAEGKVCKFAYQDRGKFRHLTAVLKIGNKEWMSDGLPVVSSDDAPLLSKMEDK